MNSQGNIFTYIIYLFTIFLENKQDIYTEMNSQGNIFFHINQLFILFFR